MLLLLSKGMAFWPIWYGVGFFSSQNGYRKLINCVKCLKAWEVQLHAKYVSTLHPPWENNSTASTAGANGREYPLPPGETTHLHQEHVPIVVSTSSLPGNTTCLHQECVPIVVTTPPSPLPPPGENDPPASRARGRCGLGFWVERRTRRQLCACGTRRAAPWASSDSCPGRRSTECVLELPGRHPLANHRSRSSSEGREGTLNHTKNSTLDGFGCQLKGVSHTYQLQWTVVT